MSKKLLDLGIQKKLKQTNLSWQEIAEQFSEGRFSNGEMLRCWVKSELKKSGQLKSKNNNESLIGSDEEIEKIKSTFNETSEIKSDGSHKSTKLLELSNEELKDPNFLLLSHGYDPKTWELFSSSSKKWHVYSKIDKIQTLYASSITARPRKDELSLEYISDMFKDMSENFVRDVHKQVKFNASGKMLELNISDLHLGKIADLSTSNDTYNYEIAKSRFFQVINDVLTRTSHYKFEKILFIYSQDFFHHEGLSQSTTGGTKMESDLRWNELFKMGVQILVEAIEMLSTIAPVETIYIASNHDRQISYYAIEYLYAWFRNNPNVSVNNDPRSRKYIEFGKNLLGFAHGHNEKKRLVFAMPTEAKEAWGRTFYREFHLGHLHSEQSVTEENGIIVRHISSVTGTDTWHFDSAYVGAVKKAQSFVYDSEKGLLEIIHTVV
jgi:hypothetical protein